MVLIYVQTQGCSANKDDSQIMINHLLNAGFDITESKDEIGMADLLIFNTCTVKNPTEDKFVVQLRKYKSSGKKIIVTGCIAQSLKPRINLNAKLISIKGQKKDEEKLNEIFQDVSVLGINQIDKIVEIVNSELQGEHITSLDDKGLIKLNSRDKFSKVETIQILTGCLGAPCTYCKTIFARGRLKSFPIKDIMTQVETFVANGVKIIHLTSQDNAVYGMDINSNLPELLFHLLNIEGDFKIRLGMGNPDHFIKFEKELVDIFNHPKMFKFLHIPIQSGSNKVLTWMRRGHTIEQFKDFFDKLNPQIDDMVWATDIICGFPYEEDSDFLQTLDICNYVNFDVINISQFYPRLGTLAAQMPQVPTHIRKQRSSKLAKEYERIAKKNKEKYLNAELDVIIESKKRNDLIARTNNYTQVIIKDQAKYHEIGDKLKVKIYETSIWHLIGEISN